jgi:DNA-binding MarR family transcriptional regulator
VSESHVRAANRLGALAVAVADRIAVASEAAAGVSAAGPAALVALHEYAGGSPIDTLRRVVGLTPSGAVRLVDRLERGGLAVRRPGADGRSVSVELTAAGAAAAERVRAARMAALTDVLAPLDEDGVAALEAVVGALLGGVTGGIDDAWRICRLCDPEGCGHHDGRCPVTIAARS